MHTAWSLTLVMYRCRFIFKLLNMHLHTRWSHSFLQMTHMWTLPNDKLFVYIQTRIKNFHQTKIFRLIFKMKLSTLLAATINAADIDRRIDVDVHTGEVTEFRSEPGRVLIFQRWVFHLILVIGCDSEPHKLKVDRIGFGLLK